MKINRMTERKFRVMDKKKFSVENFADSQSMKIRIAHGAGKSVRQIAAELDVKPEIVEDELLKMGLRPIWNVKEGAKDKQTAKRTMISDGKTAILSERNKRKKPVQLTDEQKAEAISDYIGGMTRAKVCEKYNIAHTTLNRLIESVEAYKKKPGSIPETAESKEKEPAPAPTETSSIAEKNSAGHVQFNYTPDLRFCQSNLENISKSILEIYGGFTESEKRAFDLGTIFRQVIDTTNAVDEIVFSTKGSGRE